MAANSVPQRYLKYPYTSRVGVWDITFSGTAGIAKINALTANIVPGITGYQFFPINCMFKCTGSASGPTTLVIFEESTIGSVIMSHVVADCTDGVWVGRTGGTPVVTLENILPLTTAKGVNMGVAGGTALVTTTAVRCIVIGFYLPTV